MGIFTRIIGTNALEKNYVMEAGQRGMTLILIQSVKKAIGLDGYIKVNNIEDDF